MEKKGTLTDKEKAKALKLKQKKAKAEAKKELKKKGVYRNPLETIWGKIIIIVLCTGMVAASLIALIVLMINQVNNV